MNKINVLILMATYNGEKYIEKQLESLVNQTYKNWDLIISDDCSKDRTLDIIKRYSAQYKNIKYFVHNPENGALGNFCFLIQKAKQTNYDYIMFCDQDDYWLSNKVEDSLKFLRSLKKENTPLLVYTDRELVDEKLIILNYDTKSVNRHNFEILLHQNPLYGCTMIFNKKLLQELTESIPVEFINHDHYVAMIAYLKGEINFFNKKTILYRQHENNVSGTIKKTNFQKLMDGSKYKKNLEMFFFISKFIEKNYYDFLSRKDKIIINDINKKIINGGISAVYYLLRNNIHKTSIKGTIRMFIGIFLRNGIKNS